MMLELERVSLGSALAHQPARLTAISTRVDTPQLIAVIGPNGAGKSSLLSAIAGLLPCQGEVRWQGQSLTAMAVEQQAKWRSYLPQREHVAWPITVIELIKLGVSPRISPAAESGITEVLASLELTNYAQRCMTELSGGEQQRVLLARAIIGNQPLLLIDEPCASLDIKYQLKTLAYLQAQAQQRIVLVALHDLALAARFADRIWVIHEGQLVADGTPATVLSPALMMKVFGVQLEWICGKQGVALLPQLSELKTPS